MNLCDEVLRDQRPFVTITQHVSHKRHTTPKSRHWLTSPEFPQPEELMADHSATLPAGPSDEKPFDKNAYLEFQYALNRFEGTELLRRAVREFRNRPAMEDLDNFHVYTQVHVQGYLLARTGPACRISFSTECSKEKVIWHQSPRLTAGTLVVLSPRSDNFKEHCFVAVVAARYLLGGLEPNFEDGEDENTPPRIEIFWSNFGTAVFDPSVELVMLEAKGGYFETVRHAMVGLQHAAKFESKFDKYIIGGSNKECTAAYLTEDPEQIARIPEKAKHFDSSQLEAFNRMISRELAVVQGPPGTGKTFTSVVALESYVRTLKAGRRDNAIPPVIVAAQTNHALDQLLDRCSSFDAVFARLGGRTENEAIEARTLYNIRKDSKLARGPTKGEKARKVAQDAIENHLKVCFPAELIAAEEFFDAGLITQEQYESLNDDEWETAPMMAASGQNSDGGNEAVDSIKQWLGGCIESDETYVYRPPTGQKEPLRSPDNVIDMSKEENDKERLHGNFFPTKFYVTGSVPSRHADTNAICSQASRLLLKHKNLYDIKLTLRGMVYRLLRRRLINARAEKFPGLLKSYQSACDDIRIARWEADVKIITNEKIEIVGCTTTGLTKYRGLIAALNPRILMIEEAAETREANISSALYPSLDQIVLVGDHQQLVPQVDVRELGYEPYNMHVSLFERLVNLRLPYTMLQVQRRMVPAIREVVNTFYQGLTDHPSVNDPSIRPPVPGMGDKDLWWFHHEWAEFKNADDFSYSNPDEATMIVRFVRYLVQNGVAPSQITMLSFYRGQVALLLEKLRRDPALSAKNPTKEWLVKTVDGYQGEENDIVILSIVRSARPGFVGNRNRAVVALSRAKRGLYIFGHAWNLVSRPESQQTWLQVYDVFQKQECIREFLLVACRKHGRETAVSTIEDWKTIPGDGCNKPCEEICPEGHPCKTTCHPFEQSELKCEEKCERILTCGHECRSLCGEPCKCVQRCDISTQASHTLGPRPIVLPSQHTGPAQGHRAKGLQAGRGGRGASTSKKALKGNRSAHKIRGLSKVKETFPAQFGPAVGEPNVQEPTSEQLMERYLKGGATRSLEQGMDFVPAPTHLEMTADSSNTDSLSDRWSPGKISQKDKVLREEAKQVAWQKRPCPTVIRTTYRRTTAQEDGSRLYGPRTLSNHTTPTSRLTRKQLLYDAAAGQYHNDPYQQEEQLGANVGQVIAESGCSKIGDLISFD